MSPSVRKSITIPGILADAVCARQAEFGYRSFSPFALELVCFDLRTGARHTITAEIAKDTQAAQDAVDRALVAHYKPGQERTGYLMRVLVKETAEQFRNTPPLPAVCSRRERITFPVAIWPLADTRWRELGYDSLSAYVTGLIRYDLMLGGPHMFTAVDDHPVIIESLNRETIRARESGRARKIFLDFLIERITGQMLDTAELEIQKKKIAQKMKRIALKK